jgi:hypothetical protein
MARMSRTWRTVLAVIPMFVAFVACGGSSATTTSTSDAGTPGTDAASDAASDAPGDAAIADASVDVACTDCIDDTVSWGENGGLVIFHDESSLASCRTFLRLRTGTFPDGGTQMSCTTEIGACSAAPTSVADVERALANPDVVLAFAAGVTPVYGVDSRPVDGAVFRITRKGKSIDVGSPCGSGSGSGCVPIPPGVSALASVLQALDTQELAKSACDALRP